MVRRPEENHDRVHGWLLAHNARMYGVYWSIDDSGDIYLTGRLPLAAITADVVDRLLGVVLDYADSAFNTLLELGFGSSIRREWAWRESRGESMANLAAFEPVRQARPLSRARPVRPGRIGSMTATPLWCCSATARATGTARTCSPAGSTST